MPLILSYEMGICVLLLGASHGHKRGEQRALGMNNSGYSCARYS
jgi:hypothetical protein